MLYQNYGPLDCETAEVTVVGYKWITDIWGTLYVNFASSLDISKDYLTGWIFIIFAIRDISGITTGTVLTLENWKITSYLDANRYVWDVDIALYITECNLFGDISI